MIIRCVEVEYEDYEKHIEPEHLTAWPNLTDFWVNNLFTVLAFSYLCTPFGHVFYTYHI